MKPEICKNFTTIVIVRNRDHATHQSILGSVGNPVDEASYSSKNKRQRSPKHTC